MLSASVLAGALDAEEKKTRVSRAPGSNKLKALYLFGVRKLESYFMSSRARSSAQSPRSYPVSCLVEWFGKCARSSGRLQTQNISP